MLCFEGGEAVTDSGKDGPVGTVLGFQGVDKAVLSTAELLDGSFDRLPAGEVIVDLAGVVEIEVGREQIVTIGTEESFAEEMVKTAKEAIFSNPDGQRMIRFAFPCWGIS